MPENLQLNVELLRRRVPNLTVAARNVGLRPATVSNLCNGKTPLARAEVRTLVALAQLAGCGLDELVLRRRAELVETGIKALDLLAPLVRGGRAGLVARQGLGQVVLLQELIQRLGQRGIATAVWLPRAADPSMQTAAEAAEAVGGTVAELEHQVAALRGDRDVLVGADRSTVMSGELDLLSDGLAGESGAPVTFVLVDALGESPDEEVPYGPLDTLWQLDVELAAREYFPDVDPVASTSVLVEGEYLDATHLTLQQRTRKLLRRYRELRALARVRGMEALPAAELQVYRRGERLEAFLTQPFYAAEAFAGRAGAWVELDETFDGVRRILDGAADEREVGALVGLGAFPRE